MPAAQSKRFSAPMPQGFDCVSMPLKVRVSSAGKRASSCTRWRRMSTILSTYSISTGQDSSHARQTLHAHRTSSLITGPTTFSPTSGGSAPLPSARRRTRFSITSSSCA